MNNLKWLEELAKTPILTNRNYIETIKNIPEYFETNDSLWCMMLAFRLGELRGRGAKLIRLNGML